MGGSVGRAKLVWGTFGVSLGEIGERWYSSSSCNDRDPLGGRRSGRDGSLHRGRNTMRIAIWTWLSGHVIVVSEKEVDVGSECVNAPVHLRTGTGLGVRRL